jgi:hypothetical protein
MYPISAVSLVSQTSAIGKGRLTVWLSWTTKKCGWAALLWTRGNDGDWLQIDCQRGVAAITPVQKVDDSGCSV